MERNKKLTSNLAVLCKERDKSPWNVVESVEGSIDEIRGRS